MFLLVCPPCGLFFFVMTVTIRFCMGKYHNEANVVVRRGSAGLGLFAVRDFRRNDYIIEYKGERVSAEEADLRGGKYLFAINDKVVLDGKDRKYTARYMNHSCVPNAYAEIDEDEEAVYIYAQKKINAGDEITFDYGKEYFDDIIGGSKNCLCPKCKKKN